jgi:hypothetical protein
MFGDLRFSLLVVAYVFGDFYVIIKPNLYFSPPLQP